MKRPERIDIPAAWRGAELTDQPSAWTRLLAEDEIAEFSIAADIFLASGRDLGAIDTASFPLPCFGEVLLELRTKLQYGLGFQLFRGLPVGDWPMEKIAAVYCGIGAHLGSARSQNAAGHILGHVKDVGARVSDPGARIYQTAERQSFHTDSCDAVGLLCLKEAMEGGDSMLVSTITLYNEMNVRRPDLVDLMFRPFARDRRGEVPAGKKSWYEMPVLHWHEGQLTGIYHRTYIESVHRLPDAPEPSDLQEEALDLFDSLASDPNLHLKMRLEPGDMQFVYNHTNLHDRTAFRDWPELDRRRHLLRLWLALPSDRPLPAVFAERYGSIEVGNRGGIICENTRPHVPLEP